MFGPDYCGVGNNRVHFILQHKHKNEEKYIEKSYNDTPPVELDNKTHLYTLVLYSDNRIEYYIDMELIKSGSLLTHLIPSINPSLYIDDPNDIKPNNWIDNPNMIDINAKKPDDWNENEPQKIPNPKSIKPSNWDDNIPELIIDPEVKKPMDWDDEQVKIFNNNKYNYFIYTINIIIIKKYIKKNKIK